MVVAEEVFADDSVRSISTSFINNGQRNAADTYQLMLVVSDSDFPDLRFFSYVHWGGFAINKTAPHAFNVIGIDLEPHAMLQ